MCQDIYNCICQNTKKRKKKNDLLSIMSNLQPNCCLKVDFQKWTNMQEESVLSWCSKVMAHQQACFSPAGAELQNKIHVKIYVS